MTQQYSRDELVEALQALADEVGHSPTQSEFIDADEMPPLSQIKDVFGSWNAAKEAAGLETFSQRDQGDAYSDAELLDLLRQLDAERRDDGTVTMDEMEQADDYPSAEAYKRRFGSWNAAKEQAGTRHDRTRRGSPVSSVY